MNTPLVSIIISAYNAEKYISQTIDSVLNQTWKNLEIIVVNDGSKDNTLSILSSYSNKINVVTQVNKGQDAALNNGYMQSNGTYIKFMDSDDLINPEMIEIQIQTLLNTADEYIAYGEWSRFYKDDITTADFTVLDYWKDMAPVDFLTARPDGVMLQCGIMLMPRKIIEKSGLWDERLILFNDTEFYTRILLNSKGVKFSKGARLYYRSGISQSISAQRSRKFFESTFLATKLIEKNLLTFEDSDRVRLLIANTYFNQYFEMYPFFKDLQVDHELSIKSLGVKTRVPIGGSIFNKLTKFLGWKAAKRVQLFFYKFGYRPGSLYR